LQFSFIIVVTSGFFQGAEDRFFASPAWYECIVFNNRKSCSDEAVENSFNCLYYYIHLFALSRRWFRPLFAGNRYRRFYEKNAGKLHCSKTIELQGVLLQVAAYGWELQP